MRNEYRVGELVVYLKGRRWELESGYLPVHSVGMIIKLCPDTGSFHVLFGDRVILTSDSYIRPYDPDEDLFIEYENYEGNISDMGAEE